MTPRQTAVLNAFLLVGTFVGATLLAWRGVETLRLKSIHSLDDARFYSIDGTRVHTRPGTSQTVIYLAYSPACPVCGDVAPTWKRIVALGRHAGVPVIDVVVGPTEAREVEDFVRRFGLTFTSYRASLPEFSELGISVVPSYLLVDPNGSIQFNQAGGPADAELVAALTAEIATKTS